MPSHRRPSVVYARALPARRSQEKVLPHARYAMQDESGQWKVVTYDRYIAAFGAKRLLRRGVGVGDGACILVFICYVCVRRG